MRLEPQEALEKDGFVPLAGLLRADECAALAACGAERAPGTAGRRNLLSQPWCQQLAAHLRATHLLFGPAELPLGLAWPLAA